MDYFINIFFTFSFQQLVNFLPLSTVSFLFFIDLCETGDLYQFNLKKIHCSICLTA